MTDLLVPLLVIGVLFFAALWLIDYRYMRYLQKALERAHDAHRESLDAHRESLDGWGDTLNLNSELIEMLTTERSS